MFTAIKLLDQDRKVVARAQVRNDGEHFGGQVDLTPMPASLRRIFEEYEELVNDQIFSLLDELEDRIAELKLIVVFPDSHEILPEDLQIYPSGGRVSFRVAGTNVLPGEQKKFQVSAEQDVKLNPSREVTPGT